MIVNMRIDHKTPWRHGHHEANQRPKAPTSPRNQYGSGTGGTHRPQQSRNHSSNKAQPRAATAVVRGTRESLHSRLQQNRDPCRPRQPRHHGGNNATPDLSVFGESGSTVMHKHHRPIRNLHQPQHPSHNNNNSRSNATIPPHRFPGTRHKNQQNRGLRGMARNNRTGPMNLCGTVPRAHRPQHPIHNNSNNRFNMARILRSPFNMHARSRRAHRFRGTVKDNRTRRRTPLRQAHTHPQGRLQRVWQPATTCTAQIPMPGFPPTETLSPSSLDRARKQSTHLPFNRPRVRPKCYPHSRTAIKTAALVRPSNHTSGNSLRIRPTA